METFTLPSDHVAANVRDARRALTLTLAELSERMEAVDWPMKVSTLSKIETGGRKVGVDDLHYLALALEVEPAKLLRQRGGLPASAFSAAFTEWQERAARVGHCQQIAMAAQHDLERAQVAMDEQAKRVEALIENSGIPNLVDLIAELPGPRWPSL